METKKTMEISNEEARLLEQLRANPRLEQPLRALLACAMAEHMGEAGADEAEERIAGHINALGLEALRGWAMQTEEQCAQELLRAEPKAHRRLKKKPVGTPPSAT
jgi:hypothetical protein